MSTTISDYYGSAVDSDDTEATKTKQPTKRRSLRSVDALWGFRTWGNHPTSGGCSWFSMKLLWLEQCCENPHCGGILGHSVENPLCNDKPSMLTSFLSLLRVLKCSPQNACGDESQNVGHNPYKACIHGMSKWISLFCKILSTYSLQDIFIATYCNIL